MDRSDILGIHYAIFTVSGKKLRRCMLTEHSNLPGRFKGQTALILAGLFYIWAPHSCLAPKSQE